MNKIKKIFFILSTFFVTIYSKSMAAIDLMYGIRPAEPEVKPITTTVFEILRNFIIPVIFLIGAVVYLKKSSNSILRKIITLIIALVLVILIWLGINYMFL